MELEHTETPYEIIELGEEAAAIRVGRIVIEGQYNGGDSDLLSIGDAKFIVRACNSHDALAEYFHASKSLQLTIGHPEAVAEGERKAVERYEAATKAAHAAINNKEQPC